MKIKTVKIGKTEFGKRGELFLIAGPCVIESASSALDIAKNLKALCKELDMPLIFKASFDKANRTSVSSERGPGIKKGLKILAEIKDKTGLPIISDIHEPAQAKEASRVLDVIQIPAFLSRQTDLLVAAGETGLPVNIKKGQFMAPEDMKYSAAKVASTGNEKIFLTERGTFFGYHNLVVDFRSFPVMQGLGYPVIFDATHSVQLPGGGHGASSGKSEFAEPLAKAAAATGCVNGVFLEVHPNPAKALCDGPNMISLDRLPEFLKKLLSLAR